MISNFLEILILSIVQGISEFIPVSSSAHLIIFSNIINFSNKSLIFDVGLHLGSLLAIIFYFKKELLNIPLFGWYLRKIGSIAIVRQTTTKENLNFFDKIKETIDKSKRPLLIFPQGTRVKLDERPPFKKGAGRIYKALNLPCIPVALNTGRVWPKNSFMKYTGDIHISFLEPIMPGKESDEFLKEIEDKIYTEIKKLEIR